MHSAEKMCSLKRESTETKYVAVSFSKIARIHSPFTQQVMLLTSFFQDLAEGMRFCITPPFYKFVSISSEFMLLWTTTLLSDRLNLSTHHQY